MRSLVEMLKKYWPLITIVVVFVLIRLLTIPYHGIVTWDAVVYVGMGKYLFSHGMVGTWEALRPVGLPIILGAFWKLGIDPYQAGVALSMLISAAMIALVYRWAEDVQEGAGNIAALLLAGSVIFFNYSALPVTDIISTFFAVLSLWLVYRATTNTRYLIAGITVGVALLFRFPQGLLLVVGGLVIITKLFLDRPPSFTTVRTMARQRRKKWSVRLHQCIENSFSFAGGFFLVVVPLLIINYHFYGNAFLPFIEGNAVVQLYPSLYQKGILFYVVQLFQQDPFFITAFIPMTLLVNKKYRTLGVIALTIALVIVAGYFTHQAHKELRYALAFLPYLVILSAIGIVYVLEYWKLPQLLFFGLFIIAAYLVGAGLLVHSYKNPEAPALYDFNTYLKHVPHARIMATTPNSMIYSDILLTHNLYDDWNYAYLAYGMYKSSTDYMVLNSCDLEIGCADNTHCMDKKQALLAELDKQDTKVFSETTPKQCVLEIYKLKH
jgi:4-amino-4-deoxy-L-arabinose transferase-like glycosyltransferase